MTHPDDTKLAEEAADAHFLHGTGSWWNVYVACKNVLQKQREEFDAEPICEYHRDKLNAAVQETAKRCMEICREYAAVQNKAFTQPTQAINVCANKIEAEFARAPSAPVESGKVL